MKQVYVASYFRSGYCPVLNTGFIKYIHHVFDHPKRETLEKRLEIIQFFDEFGAKATRKAFGRGRTTIYLWKQKLKKAGAKLSALAPGDKTPIHKRKRLVHPVIEHFIVEYRTNHPGVDKTTIMPALTQACNCHSIRPVSESTIGRIIHDLKARGRLPRLTKLTISGRTARLLVREPTHSQKKARRQGFLPQLAGDLVEMDTVSIFLGGIKRYIFTTLDVRTRLAFAYAYKTNSSANGRDFLGKFIRVTPFVTKRIQTDNGGEFEKHFEHACSEHGLVHFSATLSTQNLTATWNDLTGLLRNSL